MKYAGLACLILVVCILSFSFLAFGQGTEQVEIKTYYPSPAGVYKSVTVKDGVIFEPKDISAQTCDAANLGKMMYGSLDGNPPYKIFYCNEDPANPGTYIFDSGCPACAQAYTEYARNEVTKENNYHAGSMDGCECTSSCPAGYSVVMSGCGTYQIWHEYSATVYATDAAWGSLTQTDQNCSTSLVKDTSDPDILPCGNDHPCGCACLTICGR